MYQIKVKSFGIRLLTCNINVTFRTVRQIANLNFKDPICLTCTVGLQVILLYIRLGASNAEAAELAFTMCMEMAVQEEPVCRGLIDINIVIERRLNSFHIH